jgi:hypothetical protein
VPVIAVFTKYDQFRREIRMKLEDQSRGPANVDDNAEADKIFKERYLANLQGPPLASFVCLESKDFVSSQAHTPLIALLQECTSPDNGVPILLKRLLMRFLAALSTSCS